MYAYPQCRAQYTVYTGGPTVQCRVWLVYLIVAAPYWSQIMPSAADVQSTVYSLCWTVSNVRYTVYGVYSMAYSITCTLYIVHWMSWSKQSRVERVFRIMPSPADVPCRGQQYSHTQWTLDTGLYSTVYCTVQCSVKYTVYSVQYSVQ